MSKPVAVAERFKALYREGVIDETIVGLFHSIDHLTRS
jgi:hypothetical protein